ncbi:hypothetical protein J2Z49_002305 [Desulfofundulus luciae]|uniref:Transposase n=1 Tax=Desulfofundulus luciae TaxID=74702 RepID=A0ABU0B394_9FIRM|nr:hypothetical protein [Desulfofundulus luciae]MDQ0287186.1 hypothetical protein [Desulfofundulus luciae]
MQGKSWSVPGIFEYGYIVLNRISNSLSRRSINEWLKEVYQSDFDALELHYLYRDLDFRPNAGIPPLTC